MNRPQVRLLSVSRATVVDVVEFEAASSARAMSFACATAAAMAETFKLS